MSPLPTASVTAKVETQPVATIEDAADDPAIWRNAANPAQSLIIGTDKRAGVHVYDLQGRQVGFTPSPRLNNVDLRDVGGSMGVIVAASDRQDLSQAQMALFRLDTSAKTLVPLVTLPVGPGEAYGMCLWQRAGDMALFGFVVTPFSHKNTQVLNMQGHPELFTIACPFVPPGQVGGLIPPKEIAYGSVK